MFINVHYVIEKFLFYSYFAECFFHEWMLNFVKRLSWICWNNIFSAIMGKLLLLKCKTTLHSLEKQHLVMSSQFYVSLIYKLLFYILLFNSLVFIEYSVHIHMGCCHVVFFYLFKTRVVIFHLGVLSRCTHLRFWLVLVLFLTKMFGRTSHEANWTWGFLVGRLLTINSFSLRSYQIIQVILYLLEKTWKFMPQTKIYISLKLWDFWASSWSVTYYPYQFCRTCTDIPLIFGISNLY
jgi:hypothetical protein